MPERGKLISDEDARRLAEVLRRIEPTPRFPALPQKATHTDHGTLEHFVKITGPQDPATGYWPAQWLLFDAYARTITPQALAVWVWAPNGSQLDQTTYYHGFLRGPTALGELVFAIDDAGTGAATAAGGALVFGKVRLSTVSDLILDETYTRIEFDDTIELTDGITWDSGQFRFEVAEAGVYLIGAQVLWNDDPGYAFSRRLFVTCGQGSPDAEYVLHDQVDLVPDVSSTRIQEPLGVSAAVSLTAGAQIYAEVWHNAGPASLLIISSAFLWVAKLGT